MKVLVLLALCFILTDSVPIEESREEKEYVEPEYLDALLEECRYDEFSKLMGISNPRLAMPRNASDKTDPAVVDPSFIRGLHEGDILLTPLQEELARQGLNYYKYRGNEWRDGRIPYAISSKFTSTAKTQIQKIIERFNSYNLCIKLVPRNGERDYAFFCPLDGCFANLGKVGGQQPISLSERGCLSAGTIEHEICHTCGMIHEQSRPDRDHFVKVLYENIDSDWHAQYDKESEGDFLILGNYECGSAMHYPINAPGSSQPALEFINDSCPDKRLVGQRNGMTATDKSKMKKLYNC